ncbi:unnamed protein product [Natator depressus]
MEKADMVDGIKESVCWTPPVDMNTMKTCEYHALCARFKDLLLLPDDYFAEDPKFSLCYCESCHKLRGDEAYYKRGEPPRDYALPFGWCRFNLRVNPSWRWPAPVRSGTWLITAQVWAPSGGCWTKGSWEQAVHHPELPACQGGPPRRGLP